MLKKELLFFLSHQCYCLQIVERHQRSLPSGKYPAFICRHIYKLHAIVNVTEPGIDASSATAYSLICESAYENLFCTNTSDIHWRQGRCNVTGSKIECPLFKTYKTYSEFFLWKITTFGVKIGYKINAKEYVTQGKPVTPYFKCPEIARIGPHNKMFPKSDHKHDGEDCSH